MEDLKIFRKAINIYSNNYAIISSINEGIDSALGSISKVINSIKNKNLTENEKRIELNNFKNYVNKCGNNINLKNILNINKNTFITIYNTIFNVETNSLNLNELSLLCGYMTRLIKSNIQDIDITYGLEEEINADIQRELIEQRRLEEQRQLEREEQERVLNAMSPEDRFRHELENASDVEKFAAEQYNLIISDSDSEDIIKKEKAKILLDFYLGKNKPSKKVLKKIDKLKELL